MDVHKVKVMQKWRPCLSHPFTYSASNKHPTILSGSQETYVCSLQRKQYVIFTDGKCCSVSALLYLFAVTLSFTAAVLQ